MIISVVIPTYNRGSAIQKTLESALRQDLPTEEFEVLVIDDGSTDETWEFLQQNYGHNPQVRLFSIPNGGVANARNFGLHEACGEFIAYLDHDDIWLPQKLRLQREVLQIQSEVGVVYCDWKHMDESGRALPEKEERLLKPEQEAAQGKVLEALIESNFIISMSVPLIRKSLLQKVGGFDPRMVPCDDWDLWLRLARTSEFYYINSKLLWYVHHKDQQSNDVARMSQSIIRMFQKQSWYFIFQYKILLLIFNSVSGVKIAGFHEKIKESLFDRKYLNAALKILKVISINPAFIFRKQWLYLMWRAVTRNPKPF